MDNQLPQILQENRIDKLSSLCELCADSAIESFEELKEMKEDPNADQMQIIQTKTDIINMVKAATSSASMVLKDRALSIKLAQGAGQLGIR